MPKSDRDAEVTRLVAAGLTPEAAEDYYDAYHGWTRLLARPLVARQVKRAAEAAGVPMHVWLAEAVREKLEREARENDR